MAKPVGGIIRLRVKDSLGTSKTHALSQRIFTENVKKKMDITSVYTKEEQRVRLNAAVNDIHQVGTVIWLGNNGDPNVLFPNTVWVKLPENRTVRSTNAAGEILSTGGNDSPVLTADNVPYHTHPGTVTVNPSPQLNGTTNTTGDHHHAYYDNHGTGTVGPDGTRDVREVGWTRPSGVHRHFFDVPAHGHTGTGTVTSTTGGNDPIDVRNHFIVLVGWRRTS